MSETSVRFRRLVLELGHGAADPTTIRDAAALARLLDVELHALFVEDEALLDASAFPFTREISPVSGQWRPLEADRLEADFRAASGRARQLLAEAAQAAGVTPHFEVRRGDPAVQMGEFCIVSDIVVVSAPRQPGSAASEGFRRLRETVIGSVASVLFLPEPAMVERGRVVALTSRPDDPALPVAQRIAAFAQTPWAEVRVAEAASAEDAAAALGDMKERLVVIARGARFGEDGARLAGLRAVPVLVVEGAGSSGRG